ncbi:MAG: serine/threonine protein kinase [Chloroflexi bacterium OLB13]|nr:MAG: serine/threonine protein kinase [Chloroflexi bacterium OLB13]
MKVRPHDTLTIAGEIFTVAPHPAAPKMPFQQEGAKGMVFKIEQKSNAQPFALKVFKPGHRKPELVNNTKELRQFASIKGMEVCERQVLEKTGYGADAVKQEPDLEFAVLMPWSQGRTWADIVQNKAPVVPRVSVEVARNIVEVMVELEKRSIAHCDIACGNVLIDPDTLDFQLIDVEDIYAPGLPRPAQVPAGTAGYAHQTAGSGLWSADADRFAGAILIVEALLWHDDRTRDAASEDGHVFDADTLQDAKSPVYALATQVLSKMPDVPAHVAKQLVDLFTAAWQSATLADCPTFADWHAALSAVSRAGTRLKLTDADIAWPVSGWRPLTIVTPSNPFTAFRSLGGQSAPTVLRAPRLMPINPPFRMAGSTRASLRWLPVEGAQLYEVEYSADPDFDQSWIVESQSSSLDITTLRPNTAYYFRVRAVGDHVTSEWGPTVQW